MNKTRMSHVAVFIACVTLMGGTALASVTQDIEPTTIGLGEAAQLTIAVTGAEAASITPPLVSGLEFVAIGQSQRVESINGVTHATTSITYQVIPRQAGIFTIPSEIAGAPPVVLTVNPGSASASGTSRSAGASSRGSSSLSTDVAVPANTNGTAFVRLRLSKHELYVGESIPVDIQVGTRDGVVASLNGQPTLNGDAFTLDKLSSQPQRTSELIDGQSFSVFTWHSALAAVKPGHLSLTMETPLTVRIRSATRPDSGLLDQMGLNDLLNDPTLQNFFGTSTEKDITVASMPAAFDVQSLPTQDRPADFSGAVGHFTVSSDVSDDKVAAGDPISLRLHVSGTGNFDRVSATMLHDVEHWKTYAPTATFKTEDPIGYRGEKTFDQPVISTQAGAQSLPALAFSWFDPTARRYVEAHTMPLRVAVRPADTSEASAARNVLPQSNQAPADTAVAAGNGKSGLRPDHTDTGPTLTSLRPHYFETPYMVAPPVLTLAFLSAVFWVRRRERVTDEATAARERDAALQTAPLLTQMDRAAGTGHAQLFLHSARLAVQRALASRWHVSPSTVTLDAVNGRLGSQTVVGELFELADEAAYSRVELTTLDFKRWTRVVLQLVNETAS